MKAGGTGERGQVTVAVSSYEIPKCLQGTVVEVRVVVLLSTAVPLGYVTVTRLIYEGILTACSAVEEDMIRAGSPVP